MNQRQFTLILLASGASLLVILLASILVGPTPVAIEELIPAFWQHDASLDAHLILRDIRLPRTLLTLMVGASLAASGAVMQGITRNPLAGPSIMGLSGGASLGSLMVLIAWPEISYNGSILATFAGAALGYGSVLGVASLSRGGFSPTRLALAGSVVSALFSALTQGLVIARGMTNTMLYWTIGGITNVTWEQVGAISPCCVVGMVGLWWLAPGITILSLGDDIAVNLGLNTGRIRWGSTLLVLLLTGSAVAVAGPISFIGLMTPHFCRLLVGANQRRIIPLSMILGAGLTTLADVLARSVLGSRGELPLGVVTAVLGAPAFLWLIRGYRQQRLDVDVPVQAQSRTCWPPTRVFPIAVGLLVIVLCLALQHGKADLAWSSIARTLVGGGSAEENLILWSIRIPRLVFATLIGLGVAVSGAMLQAVLRNDLAEPGILGVSAGVSLMLVLLLAGIGRAAFSSPYLIPFFGVCGALATSFLVYALCLGGSCSPPRLLLTGVAVSSVASALTLLVSLQISSEAYGFVVAFNSGSLNSADWNYISIIATILLILVPLAWSCSSTLNVLRLGEQTAITLGVSLPAMSLALLTLAVAICASCLALSGSMLFLGLISPHIARQMIGADHRKVLPLSGLIGSILLLLADLLGGSILPEGEIPAGVLVSALGAPYFLYLMTRR